MTTPTKRGVQQKPSKLTKNTKRTSTTVPNLSDVLRCPIETPVSCGAKCPEWEDFFEAGNGELKRVWSGGGRMEMKVTVSCPPILGCLWHGRESIYRSLQEQPENPPTGVTETMHLSLYRYTKRPPSIVGSSNAVATPSKLGIQNESGDDSSDYIVETNVPRRS